MLASIHGARAYRFLRPVCNAWGCRRDKTIAYATTTNDDLRVHVAKGPAGPMDAYQFLLLLAAHSARHTAQIREVQANTDYPKTTAARGATKRNLVRTEPGSIEGRVIDQCLYRRRRKMSLPRDQTWRIYR